MISKLICQQHNQRLQSVNLNSLSTQKIMCPRCISQYFFSQLQQINDGYNTGNPIPKSGLDQQSAPAQSVFKDAGQSIILIKQFLQHLTDYSVDQVFAQDERDLRFYGKKNNQGYFSVFGLNSEIKIKYLEQFYDEFQAKSKNQYFESVEKQLIEITDSFQQFIVSLREQLNLNYEEQLQYVRANFQEFVKQASLSISKIITQESFNSSQQLNNILLRFHQGKYEEDLINNNFSKLFSEIRSNLGELQQSLTQFQQSTIKKTKDILNLRKVSLNRIQKKNNNINQRGEGSSPSIRQLNNTATNINEKLGDGRQNPTSSSNNIVSFKNIPLNPSVQEEALAFMIRRKSRENFLSPPLTDRPFRSTEQKGTLLVNIHSPPQTAELTSPRKQSAVTNVKFQQKNDDVDLSPINKQQSEKTKLKFFRQADQISQSDNKQEKLIEEEKQKSFSLQKLKIIPKDQDQNEISKEQRELIHNGIVIDSSKLSQSTMMSKRANQRVIQKSKKSSIIDNLPVRISYLEEITGSGEQERLNSQTSAQNQTQNYLQMTKLELNKVFQTTNHKSNFSDAFMLGKDCLIAANLDGFISIWEIKNQSEEDINYHTLQDMSPSKQKKGDPRKIIKRCQLKAHEETNALAPFQNTPGLFFTCGIAQNQTSNVQLWLFQDMETISQLAELRDFHKGPITYFQFLDQFYTYGSNPFQPTSNLINQIVFLTFSPNEAIRIWSIILVDQKIANSSVQQMMQITIDQNLAQQLEIWNQFTFYGHDDQTIYQWVFDSQYNQLVEQRQGVIIKESHNQKSSQILCIKSTINNFAILLASGLLIIYNGDFTKKLFEIEIFKSLLEPSYKKRFEITPEVKFINMVQFSQNYLLVSFSIPGETGTFLVDCQKQKIIKEISNFSFPINKIFTFESDNNLFLSLQSFNLLKLYGR